jgi:hypothetical protein
MAKFAATTDVSSSQSRAEIERTITRYGATGFAYGWQGSRAMVGFQIHDRHVRFVLPMPDPADREFTHTRVRGDKRTERAAADAYEQAVRQCWRALALVIKAKLEAVEAGIVEFDAEFLSHIVMPDGRTMGDAMVPAMRDALEHGGPTPLLPDYSS